MATPKQMEEMAAEGSFVGRRRKLSTAQKEAIKRIYMKGEISQRDLAEDFGISAGHVSRIVRGIY